MQDISDKDKIANAFRRFHKENPDIYKELVILSRDLMRKGREHYSINALFEVIRYHRAIRTNDPLFKLNNNFRALYARLIMSNEPALEDFFETRIRIARVKHECSEAYDELFDEAY
jgi:hypothetical protein